MYGFKEIKAPIRSPYICQSCLKQPLAYKIADERPFLWDLRIPFIPVVLLCLSSREVVMMGHMAQFPQSALAILPNPLSRPLQFGGGACIYIHTYILQPRNILASLAPPSC